MRSGGMHHSGSASSCHLKKGMNADKPVKGPVWQTDEVEIFSVKMVSRPQKILNKMIIFQIRLISAGFDPAI